MENVVFQCPYFVGQGHIDKGSLKLQIGNHKFSHGRDDILVGQGARTPWSAQDGCKINEPKYLQQQKTTPGGHAYSLCREQKIHFLVQKQ